jgi:hypothetical protein
MCVVEIGAFTFGFINNVYAEKIYLAKTSLLSSLISGYLDVESYLHKLPKY